jgi:hypothetical protein
VHGRRRLPDPPPLHSPAPPPLAPRARQPHAPPPPRAAPARAWPVGWRHGQRSKGSATCFLPPHTSAGLCDGVWRQREGSEWVQRRNCCPRVQAPTSAYIHMEQVAEGSYGVVSVAQRHADGALVAIKRLRVRPCAGPCMRADGPDAPHVSCTHSWLSLSQTQLAAASRRQSPGAACNGCCCRSRGRAARSLPVSRGTTRRPAGASRPLYVCKSHSADARLDVSARPPSLACTRPSGFSRFSRTTRTQQVEAPRPLTRPCHTHTPTPTAASPLAELGTVIPR